MIYYCKINDVKKFVEFYTFNNYGEIYRSLFPAINLFRLLINKDIVLYNAASKLNLNFILFNIDKYVISLFIGFCESTDLTLSKIIFCNLIKQEFIYVGQERFKLWSIVYESITKV